MYSSIVYTRTSVIRSASLYLSISVNTMQESDSELLFLVTKIRILKKKACDIIYLLII
jgi:hypothetical protein